MSWHRWFAMGGLTEPSSFNRDSSFSPCTGLSGVRKPGKSRNAQMCRKCPVAHAPRDARGSERLYVIPDVIPARLSHRRWVDH